MNTIEIIFSPTGGTEKVALILGGYGNENTVKIDLSDAKTDFTKCVIQPDDRVLIAMPSFAGRAPAVAIERLKKIAGNGGLQNFGGMMNDVYETEFKAMEKAPTEKKVLYQNGIPSNMIQQQSQKESHS